MLLCVQGRLPEDLAPAVAAPAPASLDGSDATQSTVAKTGAPAAKAPAPAGAEGGDPQEPLAPGMALLMRSYEDELKRPIRSALGGQLARSLLIQAWP